MFDYILVGTQNVHIFVINWKVLKRIGNFNLSNIFKIKIIVVIVKYNINIQFKTVIFVWNRLQAILFENRIL